MKLSEERSGLCWLCIGQESCMYCDMCVCVCARSVAKSWPTLWTVDLQAPLSLEFSRPESWIGLPFPPPGELLNPGITDTFPECLALAGSFFTTEPPGTPLL